MSAVNSLKFSTHLFRLLQDSKAVDFVEIPNKGWALYPAYLIMHYTAVTTPASSINWFKDKRAKASAHLLIDREGKITQFVPFNTAAWHAGQSSWNKLTNLNTYSIGIELVNGGWLEKKGGQWICPTDKKPVTDFIMLDGKAWQRYTDVQMMVTQKVAAALVKDYNLKDVLGHEEIAPGRKTDPGPAFPWDMFSNLKACKF